MTVQNVGHGRKTLFTDASKAYIPRRFRSRARAFEQAARRASDAGTIADDSGLYLEL
jgi:hypothetical protein